MSIRDDGELGGRNISRRSLFVGALMLWRRTAWDEEGICRRSGRLRGWREPAARLRELGVGWRGAQ